ncbi:MAG: CPBP family intramembrane metalloprotease [Myxococcales bacterium]|nr:CPBP family intramembrane metalloprotease [Myxococcales bacterium]
MKEMLSYFRDLDRKSATVLIAAPVLMVLYMYQGNNAFFLKHFSHLVTDTSYRPWAAYAYQFAAANVLFVLIPMLLIKFVIRAPLADFGFGLGDWRFGLKALAIVTPIAIPLLYLGSNDPELLRTYPLVKMASQNTQTFLKWTLTYMTFYIAWEAMFRGFLQFGLREKLGDFGSIMFQTMASVLLHYDKPFAETFSAIFAGVAWGAVALRARSFWYIMIFHWIFGLCNDIFSILRTH